MPANGTSFRAELALKGLNAERHRFDFANYFPKDWKHVDDDTIVAQWFSTQPGNDGVKPVLVLSVHGADRRLKVHWLKDLATFAEYETLIPLGTVQFGHWNRWTFDITWSTPSAPGSSRSAPTTATTTTTEASHRTSEPGSAAPPSTLPTPAPPTTPPQATPALTIDQPVPPATTELSTTGTGAGVAVAFTTGSVAVAVGTLPIAAANRAPTDAVPLPQDRTPTVTQLNSRRSPSRTVRALDHATGHVDPVAEVPSPTLSPVPGDRCAVVTMAGALNAVDGSERRRGDFRRPDLALAHRTLFSPRSIAANPLGRTLTTTRSSGTSPWDGRA